MHAQCPSVRPFVCHVRVFCRNEYTCDISSNFFHHRVATPSCYGNIPSGTLLTGASNAGAGVGKNSGSQYRVSMHKIA